MKLLAAVFSSWWLDFFFLREANEKMLTVSKRCQFWYTFIRNWSFLFSKHSWFCHLQCVGPHWKWIFDRWDLSYSEIDTMRKSCTWPLLLWPGRTCQSVPAVSLQCLRAQQAPPTRKCPITQHSPQANIRQYLCFTVQCTSGLWHTPKFLFLLPDRSV